MFRIEQKKKEVIERICRRLRVKRVDIVGSAARDDFQSAKSDVDIVVEFDGDDKLFERYFELKTCLEGEFGGEVDIIQDSAVKNPYVRKSLDRIR